MRCKLCKQLGHNMRGCPQNPANGKEKAPLKRKRKEKVTIIVKCVLLFLHLLKFLSLVIF